MATTAKSKKGTGQSRQPPSSSPAGHERASVDLLEYYKQRIGGTLSSAVISAVSSAFAFSTLLLQLAEEFEAERQNFLDRVEQCAVQKVEQHALEWENKRRAEEVKELQKVSLGFPGPFLLSSMLCCISNFWQLLT